MRASQINIKTKQNGVIAYANPPQVVFATNKMRIVQIAKRGLPGASTNSITKTATQNLSGNRAVYQNAVNSVDYPDITNLAHSQLILGITQHAANANSEVAIQLNGEMTEPSWNWIVGELVFCGANGVLTQTPNTTGFLQRVGVAIAPTVLKIEIEEPIYLN